MARGNRPFGFLLALLAGVGVGIGAGWWGSRTQPSFPAEERIVGLIDIRPELKGELREGDTLYIIVTSAQEANQQEVPSSQEASSLTHAPPLAVKRVRPFSLPMLYTVGPEDLMLPGRRLEGEVEVNVRVDRDGEAAPQPGDLEGKAHVPFRLPAQEVHILIDRVVTDSTVVE